MLVSTSDNLPAYAHLPQEYLLDENAVAASAQTVKRILCLNLMPLKEETEIDILHQLAHSSVLMQVDFARIASHQSKNTSQSHLDQYYKTFSDFAEMHYDGFIVTGAPLEQMEFEEVIYWKELQSIFDWSVEHVKATLFVCWGAQAALNHFYRIPKYPLNEKLFGVFEHQVLEPDVLFRQMGCRFKVPHSRHSEVRRGDIDACDALTLLAMSDDAGVAVVKAREGAQLFFTGHSEYPASRLDKEYKRDLSKSLPIEMPRNYYLEDNAAGDILFDWKHDAIHLYSNWAEQYVCAH